MIVLETCFTGCQNVERHCYRQYPMYKVCGISARLVVISSHWSSAHKVGKAKYHIAPPSYLFFPKTAKMQVFGILALLSAASLTIATTIPPGMSLSQTPSTDNETTVSAVPSSQTACYSRFRVDKPKLVARSCQMVWNWEGEAERQGILGRQRDWEQPDVARVHLIPPNNRERYDGCVISVYSGTAGAHARFSFEDVMLNAGRIHHDCESSGRGGKRALFNEEEGRLVLGWFVKLESWVRQ